jgi:hypothetical protein
VLNGATTSPLGSIVRRWRNAIVANRLAGLALHAIWKRSNHLIIPGLRGCGDFN